jgi:MSHA biogenesis protein MshE
MTTQTAAAAPRASSKPIPLGDLLVGQGLLTPEKLNEALSEQKRSGRQLGRVLVENGFVSEEQIAKALAVQLKVPFIDLRRFEVNFAVVRGLTEMQARRFRGVVLEDRGDSYLVGLVDPFDLRAQDEISQVLNRPVDVAVISNEQFMQTIDRVYRKTDLIGTWSATLPAGTNR